MTQQADGHDPAQQITHALEVLHSVVTGIADRQWEAPTPCGDWDVREVLNHTVGGMQIFAAQLTGRDAGKDHEADWLGEDPLAAFDLARAADLEAWRRPGSTSRSVTISLGRLPGPMAAVVHLTELVVHGVDLAIATGQLDVVDEALCAGLLAAMREMGGVDAFRVPGVFGPEVAVAPTASPHEQLAAFLGRDVSDSWCEPVAVG